MPIKGQSPKEVVHTEMHKFKHGSLHSGSKHGPLVKSRKQAIAIALSESGQSNKKSSALRVAKKMAEGGIAATRKDKIGREYPYGGGHNPDIDPETLMQLRNPDQRFTRPFQVPEDVGGLKVPGQSFDLPTADIQGIRNPYPRLREDRSWDNSPYSAMSYADGGDTGGGDVDWSKYNQPFGELKGNSPEDTPVQFKTASPLVNITEGDIDRGINVGMGAGPGIMVGPYGAMALRNAARETGNVAAERAMVHPVVGKELEKEVQSMPEWMRDPYRNSVQESRDDWARKTLEERAAQGNFNDRDVFARSGWSFTADGKPAKEISDIGAKVVPAGGGQSVREHVRETMGNTPVRPGFYEDLSDAPRTVYRLEHPAGDIHKAYDLPSIQKGGGPANSEAYFRADPLTIGVSGDPTKNTSSILHEMQHGIAYREGWPRGANPSRIPSDIIDREHFPENKLPEYQKEMFLKSDPKVKKEKLDKLNSDRTTATLAGYLHSAGENQAFNVQKRRQSAFNYLVNPQDTEIAPRALQHVEYTPTKKAGGGGAMGGFNPERGEAIGLAHQGAIKSSVPGRTDKLNLNVLAGSSVVPADVVSGLGQGNTDAGHSILAKMFTKGPYGMNLPKTKSGMHVGARHSSLSFTSKGFAAGGEAPQTPIVAAGGEFVIPPESVAQLGNGDIDLGHKILNGFYEHVRGRTISQMRKLKPPKNG